MTHTTRTNSLRRSSLAVTVITLLATATLAAAQTDADGPRFSTSAEYLLWWTKHSPAPPPLLSTGRLGDADFSVVLGGRDYDTSPYQGARFTVGYRLTADWALEGIGVSFSY